MEHCDGTLAVFRSKPYRNPSFSLVLKGKTLPRNLGLRHQSIFCKKSNPWYIFGFAFSKDGSENCEQFRLNFSKCNSSHSCHLQQKREVNSVSAVISSAVNKLHLFLSFHWSWCEDVFHYSKVGQKLRDRAPLNGVCNRFLTYPLTWNLKNAQRISFQSIFSHL